MNICISIQFIDAYVKAEITSKLRSFATQLLYWHSWIEFSISFFLWFWDDDVDDVVAFASLTHNRRWPKSSQV